MSPKLRICHAKNLPHFFELKNPPKNEFSGFTGPIINPYLEFFSQVANYSVSFERQVGQGKPINGTDRFDGCIGKMQRNETDLMLSLPDYPSRAGDILQGMVAFDETIGFMSTYYMNNHFKSDILFSFYYAFDWKIWTVTFLALAVIAFLALLHHRVMVNWFKLRFGPRRNVLANEYVIYSVLTHFSRVGQMNGHTLMKKQLFLLLSFMSLVLLHLFSTLIKTDLVVVPDPDIYFNYDDLINHKIKTTFLNGTEDYSYFKYAPDDSIQKKVWNYAVKNFKKDMFIEMSPIAFVSIGLEVLKKETVFISDEIIISAAIEAGCAFLGHDSKLAKGFLGLYSKKFNIPYEHKEPFYLRYSVDPRTKKTIKGIMMNKYFEGPVARKLRKAFSFMTEHGISFYIADFVRKSNVMISSEVIKNGLLGRTYPEREILVRNCKSVRPLKPEVELNQIKMFYFNGLIWLYTFCICMVNVVVVVENLWVRHDTKVKRIVRHEFKTLKMFKF